MKKNRKHVGLDEFGAAIGLSVMDKEIIRLKNKIIDHQKTGVRCQRTISFYFPKKTLMLPSPPHCKRREKQAEIEA
jgi:hypothetical protein